MMHLLRRGQRALLALLLGFGVSLSAQATYSNVYFFGDSLSDTGNLYTASGGVLPPSSLGYFEGRYSNGKLWVEGLADKLGFAGAANASLLGGNNYAWAGAMSDTSGLADSALGGFSTGLQAQVTAYWAATHSAADPNALYVINIGSNDLTGIAGALSGVDDGAARLAAAQVVVNNLMFSVNYLIDHGARNFLIANAPNLGLAPEASGGGFIDAATDVSLQYNSLLTSALDSLSDSTTLFNFNLFGLITGLIDDIQANGALLGNNGGLDNGSTPCIGSVPDICDHSVFFDTMHPTEVVHAMAGQAAYDLLQVPEPAAIPLLLAALFAALLVTGLAHHRPMRVQAVA